MHLFKKILFTLFYLFNRLMVWIYRKNLVHCICRQSSFQEHPLRWDQLADQWKPTQNTRNKKPMLLKLGACLFSVFISFFFFMVWLMTLALRETLHLPRSSWARLLAFYSYWNIWPHNALHCHNRTRLEAYLQKTFGTFWSFRLFLQESRSREEDGVKNNLACVHAYLDLALV